MKSTYVDVDIERVDDLDLLTTVVGKAAALSIVAWALSSGREGHTWPLTASDLSEVPGLSRSHCRRLSATVELGRRSNCASRVDRPLLSSPEAVIHYCEPLMARWDREHFWMLALDAKNRLIGRREVSVGIIDATVVHPREVFKGAITLSAANVILAHNHPSGDPQPSRADLRLTARLFEAGNLLGIPVVDHVIVGSSGVGYSLREHGELG